jgi:hypothetical protein
MKPKTGKPYFWVTTISGLVAGDKSCEWAAWAKGHFWYSKRPDEGENTLLAWKAQHADAVRARAAQLEADGWTVSVEDQNGFVYRGEVALVAGKPDIVAVRGDDARVEDCKTGRERDGDVVQVVIYLLLASRLLEPLQVRRVTGHVVYTDRIRDITEEEAAKFRPLIIEQTRRSAAAEPPKHRPSFAECRRCDISECEQRVEAEAAVEAFESEALF